MFIHDGVHTALSDDSSLAHFLHSEGLLGSLEDYLPDLAKATLANSEFEGVGCTRLGDGWVSSVWPSIAVPHYD